MKGSYLMELKDFRIEYMQNPMWLDTINPRFSWKLVSTEQDVMQSTYRIIVTQDLQKIWDSGKRDEDNFVLVEYAGPRLEASTLYQVQVEVWDNKGKHAVIEGHFETGLLKASNFQSEWITHPFSSEESAPPVFYKEFSVERRFSNPESIRLPSVFMKLRSMGQE